MKAPGFLRALTGVFLPKHEPVALQTEGPALLAPAELVAGGTNPFPHDCTTATPLGSASAGS